VRRLVAAFFLTIDVFGVVRIDTALQKSRPGNEKNKAVTSYRTPKWQPPSLEQAEYHNSPCSGTVGTESVE